MWFRKLFDLTASRTRQSQRLSILKKAVSLIACENLEIRRLLTAYTYDVPSDTSAVYLEPGGLRGEVNVFLNSYAPGDTADFTFTNGATESNLGTGMDIIDAGANANFEFFDNVPAADKPTSPDGDSGLMFQGGSNDTLAIQGGVDDSAFVITNSSTISGDTALSAGGIVTAIDNPIQNYDRFGSDVTNLDISAPYYDGTKIIADGLRSSTHLTIDTGSTYGDKITLGEFKGDAHRFLRFN